MTTDTRVFLRDIRPYFTPTSWDSLNGTATGAITLPHHVWWAPGTSTFPLDQRHYVEMAYQALVVEGTTADQEALLHPGLLIATWPRLRLPERVRTIWEDKFPHLQHHHEQS